MERGWRVYAGDFEVAGMGITGVRKTPLRGGGFAVAGQEFAMIGTEMYRIIKIEKI